MTRPVDAPWVQLARAARRLLAQLGGIVVLLLLTCAPVLAAEKRARPLSHEDVAQVWLGWSDSAVIVYRLDLKPDGTALGGYISTDEAPQLFRITSWAYKAERIEMTATPLEGERNGTERLRGSLRGFEMKLTMPGPGWQERLILRREKDLQPRWEQVKEAMRQGLAAPD